MPGSRIIETSCPDLPTRAYRVSIRNYFTALEHTPICQGVPPVLGRVAEDNLVDIGKDRDGTRKLVRIDDPQTELKPRRWVIVSKHLE